LPAAKESIVVGKPRPEALQRLMATQTPLPFTYAEVGATAGTPPAGYTVDRTRVRLGAGEQVFRSAAEVLRRWEPLRVGWVEVWPPDAPIEAGQVVLVLGRVAGIWWPNTARIVYVIDEDGPVARSGFAYGTLPHHVMRGEERFLVEWDRSDGSVWFDILAFSRPNSLLARLGRPILRRCQKRFGREASATMLGTVQRRDHKP
jgi:uncharacterized protein (UPF0548 family)